MIVEPPEGKRLVSWGTPRVQDALEVTEWPRVYRARNERQDQSFQRMLDHGALHTNDGRKTLGVPDRHQQRQSAQLDQSREAAHKRVDKQAEEVKASQAKVAASEAKGHGTRLAQRQRALAVSAQGLKDAQHPQDTLAEHSAALGPPRERAERDFRTQAIMTCRTRLLENALTTCMAVLLGVLPRQVRLDCLLKVLFERRGARRETDSPVLSWVNTTGLSVAYQRLLAEVVDGLGAMDLRCQGKPILGCLKALSP